MRSERVCFAAAVMLALAGCPGAAPADGGTDAGADAGDRDAGTDAGMDAGPDACPEGSELVVDTPDAGWARYGSVFSDELYTVTDLPSKPAGWVDQLDPSRLAVEVMRNGQPVSGCRVRWETGTGNGWAFPDAERTGSDGRVQAVWTAGSLALQQLDVRIDVQGAGTRSAAIQGRAAANVARASSVHLFYDVPEAWQRFQVEVTPLSFPPTTYYAAVGFTGGYFGIQNRGSTDSPPVTDKWLLFSVWDVPAANAQLIDAGTMTCQGFGGEGTGRQCYLTYDWKIGDTYRFEISASQPSGTSYTDFTAAFTDVSTGQQRQLATLRYGEPVGGQGTYSFLEDWAQTGSSCLATAERAAAFHDVAYLAGGVTKPVRSAYFSRVYNEWHDEICANYSYAADGGAFVWTTGGDQHVSRPVLRDESGPKITLP